MLLGVRKWRTVSLKPMVWSEVRAELMYSPSWDEVYIVEKWVTSTEVRLGLGGLAGMRPKATR